MSRLYAKKSAQQDRLAQLSDDNAFVDVEAALRRMGDDVTLETSASPLQPQQPQQPQHQLQGQQQRGGTKPSASYESTGKAAVVGGAAGGKRVYAGRGSRASEDALLSGARVPLTASLQEHHKLYVASAQAASHAVADRRSDADSDSEECGTSGGWGRRARAKVTAAQRKSARQQQQQQQKQQQRPRSSNEAPELPDPALPSTGEAAQATLSPLTSGAVVAVSVRTVKKEGVLSQPQKRPREHGADDDDRFVKEEKGEQLSEGSALMPGNTLRELQHQRMKNHNNKHVEEDDEIDNTDLEHWDRHASVPRSLVAKLSAELKLVEQWRRTVLDHPPQIINGVLSPEDSPPWGAASAGDANNSSSGSKGEKKKKTADVESAEPVLPYPLLQLYTLCPSYDVLTAAPVSRRPATHVRCADEDGDECTDLRAAIESHTTPPSREVKAMAFTDPSTVLKREVEVAGVSISFPITRVLRHAAAVDVPPPPPQRYRPAGLIDYIAGGQDASAEAGHVGGVQGTHQHHLCSVCMLPAAYRCVRCRVALFCSIDCHVLHDATRCLKFTV